MLILPFALPPSPFAPLFQNRQTPPLLLLHTMILSVSLSPFSSLSLSLILCLRIFSHMSLLSSPMSHLSHPLPITYLARQFSSSLSSVLYGTFASPSPLLPLSQAAFFFATHTHFSFAFAFLPFCITSHLCALLLYFCTFMPCHDFAFALPYLCLYCTLPAYLPLLCMHFYSHIHIYGFMAGTVETRTSLHFYSIPLLPSFNPFRNIQSSPDPSPLILPLPHTCHMPFPYTFATFYHTTCVCGMVAHTFMPPSCFVLASLHIFMPLGSCFYSYYSFYILYSLSSSSFLLLSLLVLVLCVIDGHVLVVFFLCSLSLSSMLVTFALFSWTGLAGGGLFSLSPSLISLLIYSNE